MAKAISISLASGERAEQRPPRVKLTRETWEKSSDDGVGKEGRKEGARQSEATISRGALMDKRNQRGDGRTNAATQPILPITVAAAGERSPARRPRSRAATEKQL